MAKFSVGDAAVTGFRVVKDHPMAVGFWFLLELGLTVAFGLGMVSILGPTLGSVQSFTAGQPADPTQALALLQKMAPLYSFGILLALIFYPVAYATMNRVILRPQASLFGYIRLGPDEFRQFLLMLLYIVTMVALYIVVLIAAALITIVGGIGIAAVTKTTPGATVAGPILLGVLIGLLVTVAMLVVSARLSLASALTFDSQRVDLFGSWKLTKGRVLPIIGTGILVFLLTLVIYIVGMVVIAALAFIPGTGSNFMSLMVRPDFTSMSAYFTIGRIISLVIQAGMGVLIFPLWLTPPAWIYKSITDTSTLDNFGPAPTPTQQTFVAPPPAIFPEPAPGIGPEAP